jgi:23S rRNA (cytidine1920-2'-O)/16S rRNA (cytidine1409-2'-O)-methyltransferase
MTGERLRLDQALVERGFFPSRARAQGAIAAGLVKVEGRVVAKSSTPVTLDAPVEVLGDVHDYVSRGGVKIERALRSFEMKPEGLACLDLGASTGGFTDVLLRQGARKVYCVDVGHSQLHPTLRADPRVISLEKTHARDLNRALIPEPVELIVCDVSFISLKQALPPAMLLAAPGARLIALIKPQFEVGRSRLGKGGIVKQGYQNSWGVAEEITRWLKEQPGWSVLGFRESPIDGGDGNKEFLVGAIRKA